MKSDTPAAGDLAMPASPEVTQVFRIALVRPKTLAGYQVCVEGLTFAHGQYSHDAREVTR